MKIVKLKMSAFGPYGDVQEINFSEFYGKNLFLITGNTGAGKTTIFDAICFALYGSTSGQKKEAKTLRSSFAKPDQLCFVEIEFELNGKLYRIRREPEQLVLKANGEGFKNKKHSAQLFMPDGAVKTNLKEISSLVVNQLIGFDRVSFNKVAMLPQGQFQRLLSERGEQQLKTFRSIFETDFYEKIVNGLFDFKQKIIKNFEMFEQQNLKAIDLIVCDDFEFLCLKNNCVGNFKKIVSFLKQKNHSDSVILVNCDLVLNKIETSLQKIETKLQLFEIYHQKKERFENVCAQLRTLIQKRPSLEEIARVEDLISKIESLQFLKKLVEELDAELEVKRKFLEDLKKNFELMIKKLDLACVEFKKISKIEVDLIDLQNEINNLSVFEKSMELVCGIDSELDIFKKQLEKIDFDLKIERSKSLILKFKVEIEKENELVKNLKLLIDFSLKKQILEKELFHLKQIYDEMFLRFLSQQAVNLALNLQDGSPCPVCGSCNHPSKAIKVNDNKFLEQYDVEKSRIKFLDCEKELQVLLGELGLLVAKLKSSFDLDVKDLSLADLKHFLKICFKRISDLKLNFKSEVPKNLWGLKLNSDVDYESKIENLIYKREKVLASITVLNSKKLEVVKKFPYGLQSLSYIENLKKSKILKQTELIKKKNDLINEKVDIEKACSIAKANIVSAKSNFDEVLNKKEEAVRKLNISLKQCGFSFDQFVAHLQNLDNANNFLKESKDIIYQIEKLEIEKNSLCLDLEKIEKLDQYKLKQLRIKKIRLRNFVNSLEKELINRLAVNESCFKNLKSSELEMQNLNEKFSAAKMLADVAKGTRKRIGFERYVLCSFINEVLDFASNYFKKATSGRYVFSKLVFQNLEGLNFSVLDVYSGQVRDVNTLSGGETFMASLALCLGLRDVVSGRMGGNTLGTMLIDEGFGTLDEYHLDSVVDCLNLLGGTESLIGIISHVDGLKQKIRAQIQVKQNLNGAGAYCSIKLN